MKISEVLVACSYLNQSGLCLLFRFSIKLMFKWFSLLPNVEKVSNTDE